MIAGLSGFLFGYDEGIIAGALSALRADLAMSPWVEGLVTAAVPLGSLAGGRIASSLGRRGALITAGALFALGALLSAFAASQEALGLARLTLGLAIGVAAVAAPLYIAENAPARRRGMLVSFYQLAITLGILGAYVAGFGLGDNWRTMFLIGVVPGVVLAAAMFTLRDTPRWLMLRGREAEARAALIRASRSDGQTDCDSAIDRQLAEIRQSVSGAAQTAGWRSLFSRRVLPATIVGVGLFVLQQLSGINAVIYYAPLVFREAGFDGHATQLLATIGVGVINVAMTIVSMLLIDRVGRRLMLYLGFAGTALSLAVIACAAAFQTPWLNAIALAGLFVYIAAFALSVGPIPWLMMAEIFPLEVRPLGMGLASIANWTFNAIVVAVFPIALGAFGLASVFSFFAAACLAGLLFTRYCVTETAGDTLEAIEKRLVGLAPA